MIVLHHFNLLNISWDTFIANDIFNGPQIPPPVSQEEKRPSNNAKLKKSEKAKETYNTY